MFVFSVKSPKFKFAVMIIIIIAAAAVLAGVLLTRESPENVPASSDISYEAKDAAGRTAFLRQFGWEIQEEPLEVCEVVIPVEFDEVYTVYNDIQLAQGLDLTDYAGNRVKRWTYAITNYPGYEAEDNCIRANLLICDGVVVGGDICSIEVNGFMHGFAAVANTAEPTTE